MKAMPKLAETEASQKNTRRQQLVERERRPTKPKQPHVSLSRWPQPAILFFRLPPCCRDPRGMGSERSACRPSFGPSCVVLLMIKCERDRMISMARYQGKENCLDRRAAGAAVEHQIFTQVQFAFSNTPVDSLREGDF